MAQLSGGARVIDPALLARVPGCEAGRPASHIERLPGGRGCNTVHRIDTPAGRFVLRWRLPPRDRPGSPSANELASHRLAAAAGLAPRLIDAAPDGDWLLMEYIGEPAWDDDRLMSADGIDALAGRLRALHRLPCPPAIPAMDVARIADGYLEMIAARDAGRARALRHERESIVLAARECAEWDAHSALNHGDLQASNLLGWRPMLIDWEYAQKAHPTWDLACLLAYYPALEGQQDRLLAACGLEGPDNAQILSLQRRLFGALNRLWEQAHAPETG